MQTKIRTRRNRLLDPRLGSKNAKHNDRLAEIHECKSSDDQLKTLRT